MDDPRTIDSFGFWTLTRLGADPIVFTDVRETASSSIPYILQADRAKQGPNNWYQVRFHARMTFGAGVGRAYVFASTNGYAAALIKYEGTASKLGRRIVRTASSYIDGTTTKALSTAEDELKFRNYLQYRGVQSGLNHLKFSLEVHGLQIKEAEILSDSGIEYGRKGPAVLKLRVSSSKRLIRGRSATLRVEVRNIGDWRIRNTVVYFAHPPTVRLAGGGRRSLGILNPHSARRIAFTITPLRRGWIDIVVGAGGDGGNQAAVSRRVHVR